MILLFPSALCLFHSTACLYLHKCGYKNLIYKYLSQLWRVGCSKLVELFFDFVVLVRRNLSQPHHQVYMEFILLFENRACLDAKTFFLTPISLGKIFY